MVNLGKVKTVLQMIAILLMLLGTPMLGDPIYELGYWLLLGAAVMTLWSMGVYLRAAWPAIRPGGGA